MRPPTLLLVSPKFHEYWRSMSGALERRGYQVVSHIYDDHNPAVRVRRKLTHDATGRIGFTRGSDKLHTRTAIAALREIRPDVVVVVKGDTLGTDFWRELAQYPRRALWLYDELRRTNHTAQSLRAAGAVASYSAADVAAMCADGIEAMHLPLAFDTSAHITLAKTHCVTLIGARYPSREALLRSLQRSGVPVRAYGRDWSDSIVDRLRTLRARKTQIPNGREVDRAQAYGIMAGSTATLNIHGDQDGFTMRTFEAAGVGALQLIDRPDVAELYEPEREIVVFESADEAIELARRAARDPLWSNGIREAGRQRTLAEHTFDHRIIKLEKLWH